MLGSASERPGRICFNAFTLWIAALNAVGAYNPGIPTNDTSSVQAIGPQDYLQINWLPAGQSEYSDALSHQLYNRRTQGMIAGYRGALVEFTETNATGSPTNTPWIALVSCDQDVRSGQIASPASKDVFNMAIELGAETAILYSTSSMTCELDPTFVAYYNGSMDVYATTSRAAGQAIVRQFANVAPEAVWFNSTALTASRDSVMNLINTLGGSSISTTPSLFGSTSASSSSGANPTGGIVTVNGAPDYLVATILNAGAGGTGRVGTQQNNQGQGSGGNTGLAMIILYAITGCVTVLFLIVIMSGAIRAMRHPERYGPRARNANMPGDHGQSRAGGLTKAILDTFPVMKFTSGGRNSTDNAQPAENNTDLEGQTAKAVTPDVESIPMFPVETQNKTAANGIQETAASTIQQRKEEPATAPGSTSVQDLTNQRAIGDVSTSVAPAATSTLDNTIDPNEVNDSITCPICLLDFEDGDDIRILPCDNRHRFHDACVVPWLLNVSSLCPLCRLDLAKGPEVPAEPSSSAEEAPVAGTSSRLRPSSAAMASLRGFMSGALPLPRQAGQPVSGPSNVHQGPTDSVEGSAPAAVEGGVDGDPTVTRSRFLRYVQQRRTRTRNRSSTVDSAPTQRRRLSIGPYMATT